MESLAQQLTDAPEPGQLIEVVDGVFWTRIDLGSYFLKHVNVYALKDADGWTLIDTGFPGRHCRDQWEALLAGPFSGPVKRLICTHYHPDHVGQARFIQEKTGCQLWMSLGEWSYGRALMLGAQNNETQGYMNWLRLAGMSEAHLTALGEQQRSSPGMGSFLNGFPPQFREVRAGETIAMGPHDWLVSIGAGHSPAPASFYSDDAAALITGDQILPHITPHVGIQFGQLGTDPLARYLAFLDAAQAYPGNVLALPGHGFPFRNIAGRARQIADHHHGHIRNLVDAMTEPKTVVDILPVLFKRQLDGFSMIMALTEATAHLEHMVNIGLTERWLDGSGTNLYKTA